MNKTVCLSRGFTLLELVVVITLLAFGTVAFLTLILNATRHSVDPVIQVQANAIARSYLEEVLLNGFCDPDYDPDSNPATPTVCFTDCTGSVCTACRGSGSGQEASRPLYDDVCDYDGLVNNGDRDVNDALIPGLGNYSVSIGVDDSAAVNLNGLAGTSGEAVRVDVSVTHPAGNTITLSGFKTNFQ